MNCSLNAMSRLHNNRSHGAKEKSGRDVRATVADVADTVVVRVDLVRIRIFRADVIAIGHAVAVEVGKNPQRELFEVTGLIVSDSHGRDTLEGYWLGLKREMTRGGPEPIEKVEYRRALRRAGNRDRSHGRNRNRKRLELEPQWTRTPKHSPVDFRTPGHLELF